MDMAGRIKERRTAMGYTQEELGEKNRRSKISHSKIRKWSS